MGKLYKKQLALMNTTPFKSLACVEPRFSAGFSSSPVSDFKKIKCELNDRPTVIQNCLYA